MLEQIVNSGAMDYLERGLQAANLRQRVIADNIANVNTPRFKRSGVSFEDELAKELYGEQPQDYLKKLPIVRTHARHLPLPQMPLRAMPKIEADNSTTMRVDQNNVDIDMEMASMAKNQLYDNSIITVMSQYMKRLVAAIGTGNQ